MNKHIKMSKVALSSTATSMPVAAAVAEQADPRNQGDGEKNPASRQMIVTQFRYGVERIRSSVEHDVNNVLEDISAIAPLVSERNLLEAVNSDTEHYTHKALVAAKPLAAEVADAETDLANYTRTNNRPLESTSRYPEQAPIGAALLIMVFFVFIEAMAVAVYLGDYMRGGKAQALGFALLAGIMIAGAGAAIGLGIHAWSVTDPVRRITIRALTLLGVALGAFIIVFVTAWRVAIETGQPILYAARFAGPDAVIFILFSMAMLVVAAVKMRSFASRNYSDMWGETPFYRRLAEAARLFGEMRRQYTAELGEQVFEHWIVKFRDDEQAEACRLNELYAKAIEIEKSVLKAKQDVHLEATNARTALQQFDTTFSKYQPDVKLAPITIDEPAFPEAKFVLGPALAEAEKRLHALRNIYADLDHKLKLMREEAERNLETAFDNHLAAAKAERANSEETTNA